MTSPAVNVKQLRHVLATADFAQLYRFELDHFAVGECTLRIPYQDSFQRPGGIVAGPVFMAAADIAVWLAIMTLLGDHVTAVTTELNTRFLSSAKREDFTCHGSILKTGRRLIHAVAECRTLQGKLLTHHTCTYIKLAERDQP